MMKKMYLVFFLIFAVFLSISANAFIKSGYVLSNPGNVKYKISSTIMQYSSTLVTSTATWADKCAKIGVSNVSSDENIYFYGDLGVANGTYATCHHTSSSYKVITFYSSFVNLSSVRKNETIVHEVGHALGLNHTQTANDTISVMRAVGFNDKDYPLSDDIAGIADIYK